MSRVPYPTAVSAYDYVLPEGRIATHQSSPRDSAKLLLWPQQNPQIFQDLPDQLNRGDVLVVNSSKVIPARIHGVRPPRDLSSPAVPVEILLHQPRGDFARWNVFAKPAKRIKVGDRLHFADKVIAEVVDHFQSSLAIAFHLLPTEVEKFLEKHGEMPLPPYIGRTQEDTDKVTYQTIYADPKHPGSVAAPTAGLHFTPELLERLRERGIIIADVTLHVGAGTFQPVMAEDIRRHTMHTEWGRISPEAATTIRTAKARGNKIIAVGTTATRLLETAARSPKGFAAWQGNTDIFITPGFKFQIVDRMITNFHLPKSTLLMLVAAFIGFEEMHRLYAHALAGDYRFYSYGDACLLTRTDPLK